jgi:RimJ/RimL family protein N-acetyltransferase
VLAPSDTGYHNPFMKPFTLTTDRLRLRPLTPDDTDAVWWICQDPEIQRWLSIPSPYERRHAEHFLQRIVPDGWRSDTVYTFGVVPVGDGPLLGAINLHRHSGTWEIGFWTAKEHRYHGYTAEAVTVLARCAFTVLAAERLEWRAEAGNHASRAVAEKAGFVWEGTLRSALLHRGTLRDLWIGGLLPSDLGLPSSYPYLPAPRPDHGPASSPGRDVPAQRGEPVQPGTYAPEEPGQPGTPAPEDRATDR